MQINKKAMVIWTLGGLMGLSLLAQNAGERGQRQPGQQPARAINPVMAALDKNGDGTLDADEIKNASAALLTLDTNGDGKLTPDELRPRRPEGAGRPPGGEGRQGGQRQRPGQ